MGIRSLESFKTLISSFKKSLPAIFIRVLITLFLITFCMTGCALIKLKKEIKQSLESTVILGRIYGKFSGKGPIIVAACLADETEKIVHYTVLHDAGEYELLVNRGNYHIFAFWDKNSNLSYDPGEPAGQYEQKSVCIPSVGVISDIDIVIPETDSNLEIHPGKKSRRSSRRCSAAVRQAT